MNNRVEIFLNWLAKSDPLTYNVLMTRLEDKYNKGEMNGLFDLVKSAGSAIASTVKDTYKQVAPAIKETATEAAKLKLSQEFQNQFGRPPTTTILNNQAHQAAIVAQQNELTIKEQWDRIVNFGLPPQSGPQIQVPLAPPTETNIQRAVARSENNLMPLFIIGGAIGLLFLMGRK
jgi:hypothetical protein